MPAQVVRKCTGYCFCVQAGVIHQLLLLTTLLLSSVAPQLCIWLLLRKCPLTKAELVRVKVRRLTIFLQFAGGPRHMCLSPTGFLCVQLRNGKQHLVRIRLLHPARLPGRQQVTLSHTIHAAPKVLGIQAQSSPLAQLKAFALQWINQHSVKGPRLPHRVFCVSARLYLFNSDLSAFLPLDDMPSNMPQQIWSAVQDLAEIDAGMAYPHTSLHFCHFEHISNTCLVMCMMYYLVACRLCKFA